MAQDPNSYVVSNLTASAVREDMNQTFQAILTLNSGSSAPPYAAANSLWYDTTNDILYVRNEDNDAWIHLFTLNQTADAVDVIRAANLRQTSSSPIDIEDNSGTKQFELKVAAQATAEAGTENQELMTPLRTKQAIDQFAITETASDLSGTIGYIKYSNTLMVQWGYFDPSSTSHTLTFPVAFPSEAFNIVGSMSINIDNSYDPHFTSLTRTNVAVRSQSNRPYFWVAHGK